MEELIKKAKQEADIVVVHAHWGEENEDVLTETMTALSQMMVDWGADIIFGNHTHIVQDLRLLKREGDGQLCPVIFSNGNFVSGQKERSHLLSGLEVVTAAKNPDTGAVQIENVEYLPVLTHYEGDRKNAVVVPLDQYTDEMAAQHGVAEFEGEPMSVSYLEGLLEGRQVLLHEHLYELYECCDYENEYYSLQISDLEFVEELHYRPGNEFGDNHYEDYRAAHTDG